jgi:UDP-N-acetylmuramoyl-tripeptide--D-alanyl-D-alanine ligase
LGDMLELGRYSARLHHQLGVDAARTELRVLVTAGAHAQVVAAAARRAGMSRGVYAVADAAEATRRLRSVCHAGDTVLLKASRGLAFESVFEQF